MSYCCPSYAIPSCASTPVIGFGSPYSLGCGYGPSYSGLGYGSPCYSYGVPARSLGTVPGVNSSCISQLPPSEVVIYPSPSVVTIAGPILSSTGEPVAVGGSTAYATGGYGYGYGYGLSRYGRRGYGYGRGLCRPSYIGCGYIPIGSGYCGYPC